MYPNMYRLDNIDIEQTCYPNELGYYQYPTWTQLSRKFLHPQGLYLLNTASRLYLCIDPEIPAELFESMFFQDGGEILLHEVETEDEVSLLSCIRSLIEE